MQHLPKNKIDFRDKAASVNNAKRASFQRVGVIDITIKYLLTRQHVYFKVFQPRPNYSIYFFAFYQSKLFLVQYTIHQLGARKIKPDSQANKREQTVLQHHWDSLKGFQTKFPLEILSEILMRKKAKSFFRACGRISLNFVCFFAKFRG